MIQQRMRIVAFAIALSAVATAVIAVLGYLQVFELDLGVEYWGVSLTIAAAPGLAGAAGFMTLLAERVVGIRRSLSGMALVALTAACAALFAHAAAFGSDASDGALQHPLTIPALLLAGLLAAAAACALLFDVALRHSRLTPGERGFVAAVAGLVAAPIVAMSVINPLVPLLMTIAVAVIVGLRLGRPYAAATAASASAART